MGEKMKQYVIYGSIVIVAVFALPLFWLKLMQWAFLDNTAIIAEGISFSSAIISGVISGGLTLVGVTLTLKNGEIRDKKKAKPQKIAYTIMVLNELKQMIEVSENFHANCGAYFVQLGSLLLEREPPDEQRAKRLIEYTGKVVEYFKSKDKDERIIVIGAEIYLNYDSFKNNILALNNSIEEHVKYNSDVKFQKGNFSSQISKVVLDDSIEKIKDLVLQQLQCFRGFQEILKEEKTKLQGSI